MMIERVEKYVHIIIRHYFFISLPKPNSGPRPKLGGRTSIS